MKCQTLLIDKGRAKLYGKAEYDANVGKIKRGFRKDDLTFYIPDKCLPIPLQKKRGQTPLFVVNRATLNALTLTYIPRKKLKLKTQNNPSSLSIENDALFLIEETDTDQEIKLNLLTKKPFWEQVAEKLSLGKIQTLIYLFAGYGGLRLAEFIIQYVFTQGR